MWHKLVKCPSHPWPPGGMAEPLQPLCDHAPKALEKRHVDSRNYRRQNYVHVHIRARSKVATTTEKTKAGGQYWDPILSWVVDWHLLSRPPLHRLEYRRGQGVDVVGGRDDFQPGQAGKGLIDELLVLSTREEAVLEVFTEIRRRSGRPEASAIYDLIVLELCKSSRAFGKRRLHTCEKQ